MISIIVPVYNSEKYLDECLRSIQKQSYSNFEVICVNDGSPDNSADICQRFVDKDKRFRLINQENGGVSSARNRALKEAKGEYVCFVDSDDVIDLLKIWTLVSKDTNSNPFAQFSTYNNLNFKILKTFFGPFSGH